MKISELMVSDLEMIGSTKSLTEAVREMKSLNVGVLPIREGAMLIGVVPDRVEETAKLMEEHPVRRLVVCDRDRTLGGTVSLGEWAVRTGKDGLSGETLERSREPAAHA